MAQPRRIVVIGGVAAGPKAASRARRVDPLAEITLIERDPVLSYAGCGLPYYVSGVVSERDDLMATPIGVLRDPAYFEKAKDIRVLPETEAVAIDRARRMVRVRSRQTGEERAIPYDKLILATGASAVVPPIPGIDLPNVLPMKRVEDADLLKTLLASEACQDVAIVGAGLIGLEMAEALHSCGRGVTLIERLPQILPFLDADMALLLHNYVVQQGVRVMTGAAVEAIEADASGRAARVVTDQGTVEAGAVIVGIGFRPNTSLAREAGLILGPQGGILVNQYMQTSDPDVYAAGDCTEKACVVRGTTCLLPLGSTANKEGRVAGTNAAGGHARFPGVVGTGAVKVFGWNVARTGLTEADSRRLGVKPACAIIAGPDRAHYYPEAKTIIVKLIADSVGRKLLGAQILGPGDAVKRIDVAATALTAGMGIDDIACLDLAYAPPYAPAMDPLITAADALRNALDGLVSYVFAAELEAMRQSGDGPFILDVRTPAEYQAGHIPGATLIPLGALRGRLREVPRDRPVVALCKTSLRAYEAARILSARGDSNISVLAGGMAAWPYDTEAG